MGLHYDKSPLVEAVFEVYAVPTAPAQAAPGGLEGKLRSAYAGKREVLQALGVHVQLGPGPNVSQDLVRSPDRVRLWSDDGRRMVQFGADMCALNALPPYGHFEDYQPAFKQLFQAFADEVRPGQIAALGQRYINRIVLPRASEAATYFTVYPRLPEDVARTHPPFSMLVHAGNLSDGAVVLTLTYQGLHSEQPTYILDLYARSDTRRAADWDAVHAWHREAHEAIVRCFESALTPSCQLLLGRRLI